MTKYKNTTRTLSDLEQEVAELDAARNPQPEAPETPETPAQPETATPGAVAAQPKNAEDTWAKRYADLRKHADRQSKEYEDRIKALEGTVQSLTRQQITLPKSDEEIEAWSQEFPDVAKVIETIAAKKALEATKDMDRRIAETEAERAEAAREKAYAHLLRLHPDFDELRDTQEFQDWVRVQPKNIRDALWDNETDYMAASRAIDLYKADAGITTRKPAQRKTDDGAARSVAVRPSTREPSTAPEAPVWSESRVSALSAQDYEKNMDEINKAIRSGKFVYDLTGAAR